MGNTLWPKCQCCLATVHPRWCGEHKLRMNDAYLIYGSSPLVWGTRLIKIRLKKQKRFIPAGVGNTRHDIMYTSPKPVHPRWCGEHQLRKFQLSSVDGSSPLVWGTLTARARGELLDRFIPAGVGNTKMFFVATNVQTVHPRWCGEHEINANLPRAWCGSSPLVWGTL